MRRSRRFRRIFRKVNIFAVVFVAFFNACIYSPIHSLAADSDSVTHFFDEGSGVLFCNSVNENDLNAVVVNAGQLRPSMSVNGIVYSSSFSDSSSGTIGSFYSLPVLQFSFSLPDSLKSYPYIVVDGSFSLYFTMSFFNDKNIPAVDSNIQIQSSEISSGVSGYAYPYFFNDGSNSYHFTLTFDKYVIPIPANSMYLDYTVDIIANATWYSDVADTVDISISYTSFYDFLTFSGSDLNGELDEVMNGYDSSTGDQVASDFESGAASYDQAEDNLFNSADSALTGFKFFDFSTFGTITTGLSFVSGIMTSIYNNFGAMQGLGIVLSVLFSVMFMAIVIGFYRYFK